MKYYHKLTDREYQDEVVKPKLTVGQCMKKYKQPEWCEYPDALESELGCLSLVSDNHRKKISKSYCKRCDHKRNRNELQEVV